jgi:hypothetical protein
MITITALITGSLCFRKAMDKGILLIDDDGDGCLPVLALLACLCTDAFVVYAVLSAVSSIPWIF